MILSVLQSIFLPPNESMAIVKGFYDLEKNSIDVLFLGPSQSYFSVNAQKLTNEYGIPSYDFGASSQELITTYYYLQEALKTQNPKVVMVEICQFFYADEEFAERPKDNRIVWNYSAMHFSFAKYRSLYERFHHDFWAATQFCFLPIMVYHSNWVSLPESSSNFTVNRGYLAVDTNMPLTLAYTGEDEGEEKEIPRITCQAITNIVDLCSAKGIEVIFFKSPVSTWTRNDSKTVKSYMQEQGLVYLELNDYLDQIGIDPAADFYNEWHLNVFGANKTTDFIAQYLMDRYPLGRQETQ